MKPAIRDLLLSTYAASTFTVVVTGLRESCGWPGAVLIGALLTAGVAGAAIVLRFLLCIVVVWLERRTEARRRRVVDAAIDQHFGKKP